MRPMDMMSEDYADLASKPAIPALPVKGCVDVGGRLIAADAALEALQEAAGSRLGGMLAIPPLVEISRLARKLNMEISREARIADADHRYEVLVKAMPDDDVVRLSIIEWVLADAPATKEPAESLDDTLGSPLGQIIEAAEAIGAQSDGPLQENYAEYAGDIATAGRHLLSVIRSMSAQVGGSVSEPVDMGVLALEAVQLVDPAAQDRDVRVRVNSHGAPGNALGERRAILQILVNILGNAIRHSPRGGTVRIDFKAGAGSVETVIKDEGPGIAPDDYERIFTAYERAHAADDGGKGLGLAISRRLARSMAGDVVLGRQPEQGAHFTLRLPAA